MSCLLVLAFVGCTYFTGGWISALGTYTVCYLMYNYTSQQTLRPHFSRTSCGSAWGIILSITLGYVVFVHPVLSLDYITLSSVTHTIIFVCLILMTCLYFYLSISTIPGYVDTEFDRYVGCSVVCFHTLLLCHDVWFVSNISNGVESTSTRLWSLLHFIKIN